MVVIGKRVVQAKPPMWVKCPSCTVIFDYNDAMKTRQKLYGYRISKQEIEHFGEFCLECKPL